MINQGITGVTIILSGDVNTEMITDSEGQYSATNLQGTVTVTPTKEGYCFSSEEELLRTKLNEFLSALQNKDLDTLASLIDDNYIDEFTGEDKEVILDKYQHLMSQIEIHNYNISSENFYRYENQNNCSSNIVFDITVNRVRSATEEYLSMIFNEENSDWLITSLYFSLFNILE